MIGSFKLVYGLDLNFNAGKVSDTSYLGDYVYSEESDLNSEISLGRTIIEKQQFLDGSLSYFRKKEQGNSLNEYYSLSGSYVKDIFPSELRGKLRVSANLNSSVNVNDDNSVSRPPSSAQIGVRYNQRDFLGPALVSSKLFTEFNSFVNSADVGTTNEEFSFQYGVSTIFSAPRFLKEGKVISLNPRFSLSFNGQENDILGDFFIATDELSRAIYFLAKKLLA